MRMSVKLSDVEVLAGIIERQMKLIRDLARRNCDTTIYVIARDGLTFTFSKLLEACGVKKYWLKYWLKEAERR